jgi:hypothetical protein
VSPSPRPKNRCPLCKLCPSGWRRGHPDGNRRRRSARPPGPPGRSRRGRCRPRPGPTSADRWDRRRLRTRARSRPATGPSLPSQPLPGQHGRLHRRRGRSTDRAGSDHQRPPPARSMPQRGHRHNRAHRVGRHEVGPARLTRPTPASVMGDSPSGHPPCLPLVMRGSRGSTPFSGSRLWSRSGLVSMSASLLAL